MQESLIKQFNKVFDTRIDSKDPMKLSDKECNMVRKMIKARRETLNDRLVKVIDTQCAADREALL